MTNLLSLQCPACGAPLQTTVEKNRLACQHCGNQYLFDRTLEEVAAAKGGIQPTVTYTQHLQQWLRVADYEVFVHSLSQATITKERVLYIEIAYRNPATYPLTCRHDQWVIFDTNGYTYEPLRDFDKPEIYKSQQKPYVGLSRVITPGMNLRGWLGFLIPETATLVYLQFSGGSPTRTVEIRILD